MENLLKLSKAFDRVKWVTIVAVVAMTGVCIATLAMSFQEEREYTRRIYIVNRNAQFEAIAGTVAANRPVEIGYHVRRFHELFFTVIPDAQEIEGNTRRAFYLADDSAKKLYDDLREQDFYTEIIQGNVVQKIVVDSVVTNSASYPYQAITYSTITQTRATTSARKKMVSRCELEDMPRSLNSPNGLFIRRFRITESTLHRGS